ncbi:hypothetical protein SAMN04488066_11153 [Halorubrum aquaticum]|uniref:DUF8049 domain-containing protein n=1 Tax=Halorubrum aquaticum TaxID=387340 RepID=A0A1I3BCD7_9EURY|nr:hypothetical protein [Halorubrum aquaticum]SFH59756.1 hypothetical protein SAMN04488066_11153 [Halorubrum aquaticum]
MEIERAREDVLVAASAGISTVAVAVLSSVVPGVSVGTLPSLAPLAVYLAYLFTRKGGPYGSIDAPRNWATLAVVVGVVVLAAGTI